jgi:tetratricopeptide (TPR) repeat protein
MYDRVVKFVGPAVALLAFAVLVAHAAPGLALGDAGELTTAAFTLGVAHETGFALYCVIAKAAALVPLGDVAFRVNVLSAAAGALAAWLAYRLVRDHAARASANGGDAANDGGPAAERADAAAELGGVAAAAVLISGLTFFRASTVAEVYAPTAAAIALAFVLLARAAAGERAAGPVLALVGGLSLGLHAQLRIVVGPASAVWALWRLRRGDRWPLLAPLALALGAAVLAYLPLRAARAPAADWADPRTLGAALAHVTAARIRRAFGGEILTGDLRVLGEHLATWARLVEAQLGVPALLAAAGGLVALARRRATRVLGVALAVALASDALYSAWVNPMGLDDLQDGAPTALVIAIAAGAGVVFAARRAGRAAPALAAVVALVVALPAALADGAWKHPLGPEPAAWTGAALAQAPPRALVLTTSDDLSAGVLYEQVVAGARPDVTALVRQQLWDGALVAQRTRAAGGEVHDPAAGRSERARIAHEDELARALIAHELPLRAILWEPAHDAAPPGTALEPGVPLDRVVRAPPAPLPPWRPLAEDAVRTLAPARDPSVWRLASSALDGLGRVYFERGAAADAEALFAAALRARPDDAAAATNLAVARARRGDFAGARELVERVVAREPGRVVARVNAGRYALALGDVAAAEAHFAAAHRRAPRDPAPLVGLEQVARARHDQAAARALINDALRVAPNDPEARAAAAELEK